MISVVVPVMNEEENIVSLLAEISTAAEILPISEIIYVDDGSTDKTLPILQSLKSEYKALRVIQHDKRSGQSAAMWAGVKASGNDLVATLDGDGQNNPADIRLLYDMYEKYKKSNPKMMIVGQREKRNDNLGRRLASRFANKLRASILKDGTRDTGCSLKLFRRKDYLSLPYFNHMHRFLPALMMREGVQLKHVDVSHRSRQHGISKYGNFSRALVGVTDLIGVWWLQSRPYTHPTIIEDTHEGYAE